MDAFPVLQLAEAACNLLSAIKAWIGLVEPLHFLTALIGERNCQFLQSSMRKE